ncbi:MAG: hypothetical protein HYZ53_30235 [Planctomycetes bacterium]|nr:hypothetical protein [Planctomycetota bacterium]
MDGKPGLPGRDIPPPGYKTQSEDTSYDVERMLFEAYRRMQPWEKARRIAEDSRFCDELSLIGIRSRHPEATDEELRLRLGALRLGRETMLKVFGWDPATRGY